MTRHTRNDAQGIRTTAVHGGEAPDPVTGASSPNLVMSTTFASDEPAGFSAHNLDGDSGFLYSRWGNPTARQLDRKLAALEGGEGCVSFASGMAASSAVLFSLLKSGDHLIAADTNYAGTAELVRDTLPRFQIEVSLVDTSDPANVANALRAETKMVWLESPANPTLRLADIAAISKIAHQAGALVAIDSTFATPIATRPLELGADYVIHSLTKYIGGHGDALGGAVIGGAQAMAALNVEAGIHYGGVISPFNAWLIMRGAATLPLRMKAHEEGALVLAKFLEDHAKVKRVLYPGLVSHPQHALAKRQMDNFSGMIAFQVADGEAMARRLAKRLEIIHHAVSLGHHRSLIFWIGTGAMMESSFRLEGAALDSYRALAGDGLFRLSVGLEDPADLCRDLEQAMG